MRSLILANAALNAAFLLMAFSEMSGLTAVHESLPWWLKWWWIVALSAGNLIIHAIEWRVAD